MAVSKSSEFIYIFSISKKALILFVHLWQQYEAVVNSSAACAITADRDQRAWIYDWIKLN